MCYSALLTELLRAYYVSMYVCRVLLPIYIHPACTNTTTCAPSIAKVVSHLPIDIHPTCKFTTTCAPSGAPLWAESCVCTLHVKMRVMRCIFNTYLVIRCYLLSCSNTFTLRVQSRQLAHAPEAFHGIITVGRRKAAYVRATARVRRCLRQNARDALHIFKYASRIPHLPIILYSTFPG